MSRFEKFPILAHAMQTIRRRGANTYTFGTQNIVKQV